ncbi:MAG: tetratricopeptide repeat protein [Nitrospirae bacterium]|nr:tetratricopeptide repeat protein [Nitrospirota bacterium]
MIRNKSVRPIFVVVVIAAVLSACGSKSSSSDPSTAPPPPIAQVQGQAPVQQTPGQAPQGRDPFMEQGAQFMTKVMEHKRRLEKDPKDKEALLFLGNANYDISRFDQAKEYYKRYLEIDPARAGVRTDLATSYYKIKDVDSAVRELKTVVAQVPDHEAALYNLGLILLGDKQDKEGAMAAWEALLAAHPNHPKALEVRKQIDEMKKKS